MNRDTLLLLLGAAALFLFSRQGGAGAGAALDYVPADEPLLYGTPDALLPFDYDSPSHALPIVYQE